MIVSVTEDSKLKTYLSDIRKQQKYVDTFSPVYCTDTIFSFWNDEYLGLNCNSTFDLRKDPIYSKDLTTEELQSLVKDDYFSYEELKIYFDRILEEYYLNTNE